MSTASWDDTARGVARWRLHTQHLVGPQPDSAAGVVGSLLAVQAENPAQSAWAVAARVNGNRLSKSGFQASLDAGEVLRTHVLRPTWHYVLPDDVRWLVELTAPRVLPTYEQQLRRLGLDQTTLAASVDILVGAVQQEHLTREQLAERLTRSGLPASGQHVMLLTGVAELSGLIVSGVADGGRPTYAPMEQRAPAARRLDREEALAELALRYLTGHGPATERDLAYWATLPLGDVCRAIAAVAGKLESFQVDGRMFWFGRPDPAPERHGPGAHLLQILDEYYRGYQDSRRVLDVAALEPVGRTPSIGMALIEGQLVAGMQRAVSAGRVRFTLTTYRPISDTERAELDRAAARYARFLGLDPVVVVAG